MDITAKSLKGDLTKIGFNLNEDTNTRICTPTVVIGLTQAQAKKTFGDEFAGDAFATMARAGGNGTKESGQIVWGMKEQKINATCSNHEATILGKPAGIIQPEVFKILSVKNKAEITVHLRLPFDLKGRKNLGGELAMAYGAVIEISLEAKQLPLKLPDGAQVEGTVKKSSGAFGNPKLVTT